MQKSNLIAYLKQFSKRDWREFQKFIRSPYFNQREDIIILFDYLQKKMQPFRPEALERTLVFKKLYPKQSFDEKQLRHVTSFLLKNLKKYLAHAELEEDQIQSQQYLCYALRKKRMESFFEKELSNSQKNLEQTSFRDSTFYLKKYQLSMEEAIHAMPQRRSGEMNFQSIADQLSISFISSLLRLSCNIQSYKTISGQLFDIKLLPDVLKTLDQGAYADVPAISLYYHCYNAIENLDQKNIIASEESFQKLKMLIQKHWQIFPSSEIRDIYLFTINYCIKRMNTGDRNFIREAFELYRSGLNNETLLEEGMLSSFTYKNITRIGIALNESDWVAQFLEDYKKYLFPRERENTWRYNLAFFYFRQQKYKPAMQLLLQVEFKDVLNNLDARRMLLKSYFELGEYNALDSLLDSFSRYIHRQKEMGGYHRDNYLNLIRFVKKIIHSGTNDKKALMQLKEEINNTQSLAERDWLLEKLER